MVQALGRDPGAAEPESLADRRGHHHFTDKASPSGVHVHRRARHAVRGEDHHGRHDPIDRYAVFERLGDHAEGRPDFAADQAFRESVFVERRFGSVRRPVADGIERLCVGDEPVDGRLPDLVGQSALLSQDLGRQIADQFLGLFPSELLEHFGDVTYVEQVVRVAEEMGRHGAFVEQRQDLVVVAAQAPGGDQALLDAFPLLVLRERPDPSLELLPGDRFGQPLYLRTVSRAPRQSVGGEGQRDDAVVAFVLTGHPDPVDEVRNLSAAVVGAPFRGDVAAAVADDELQRLLFGHPPGQHDGHGLGYGPLVRGIEPLLQEQEVGVGPLRSAFAHAHEDVAVPHFDRKGLQVVAAAGKTTAAAEVVAPAVPVAGQNAVADAPPRERIAHVGTLVVRGEDRPFVPEEGDASSLHLHGLGLAVHHLVRSRHPYESVLSGRHNRLPLHWSVIRIPLFVAAGRHRTSPPLSAAAGRHRSSPPLFVAANRRIPRRSSCLRKTAWPC